MELFASRMSSSHLKSQFPHLQSSKYLPSHRHLSLPQRTAASFQARFATPGPVSRRSRLASSDAREHKWVRGEAEYTSYDSSDDESSYLSLSEKPDRSMALLDDYEMEELEFAPDPNHKSGKISISELQWWHLPSSHNF